MFFISQLPEKIEISSSSKFWPNLVLQL